MKLGLLGDIHGNDLALESVLGAARSASVDALLVTGDIVGYYFQPRRVLELLGGWRFWMVRGNHEDMLREALKDSGHLDQLERRYGHGIRKATEELTKTQAEELFSLPHPLDLTIDSRRILLCHGAPWDNNHYVYPDADVNVLERCATGGHDLVVLGHTHHAMVRKLGNTTIANPGSVGQPRDRRPGASWALFDTSTGEIELRRESYSVHLVAEQARIHDPALPYLADVLTRT